MLFRQRREPPPPLPESVPPLPRKDPSLIGPTNIIAEIFEEKCLQAEIFCKRKRRRPEQPASLPLYGGKCLSLSEAPCGAITVSVGDFASRRTCAGTHGVLFAALPGSAGADEYIVAEMEPAKGKGGKFLTKRHEKNRNFPAYGRDATTRRPTASSTSTFHFPLTGEMQRATFLPSNSACQEVHLREPAFAIFWNIDFSFRNRMFDVGSRQIA